MENISQKDKDRERMRILLEINSILTSSYDLDELIRKLFDKVADVSGAVAGSLWLKEAESDELVCKVALFPTDILMEGKRLKMGKGIAGLVAQSQKGMIIKDVTQEPQWDWSFDRKSGFRTRSILCVPLVFHNRSIGSLQLINKLREEESFSQDDLDLLSSLANNLAAAIENARLFKETQQKRQMERELEIARSIQESMLPQKFPVIEGIEVAATALPAQRLGGDLYDLLQLGRHRYGFVIADVSGNSLPAALFMAKTCGLIRAESREGVTPANILRSVNEMLYDHSDTGMFITVVYAIYDSRNNNLEFANAGHCLPLLIHQDGAHHFLSPRGKPLGIVRELTLPMDNISINKGDLLMFYTDGIVEAENENNEQFGETRFIELLKNNRNRDLPEIIDRTKKAVLEFTGGIRQDDLAFLTVRRQV